MTDKQDFFYKYRVISTERLPDLQLDIDHLRREGKLSEQDTYQEYIDDLGFSLPEEMPGAKSLVVLAVFTRLMLADFEYQDEVSEVMVPPQYYRTGLTRAWLEKEIHEEIMGGAEAQLAAADSVHMKLSAVRSGLGKYGRNNICYVDEMGSFITLYAYYTDHEFPAYDWHEIEMMERCQTCWACQNQCPVGAIADERENFVVNAGKCLTLYNEVLGDFPDWMPGEAHNALMGCMHCQLLCPANQEAAMNTGRLGMIRAQETRLILDGIWEDAVMEEVAEKLNGFPPAANEEYFPIFTRNLGVLLEG